jgi:hypothetical protein
MGVAASAGDPVPAEAVSKGGAMRRFSFRPTRSQQTRMSLAWLVIVALAGCVLFASIWVAERAQEAAVDRLSTSSLPPPAKPR